MQSIYSMHGFKWNQVTTNHGTRPLLLALLLRRVHCTCFAGLFVVLRRGLLARMHASLCCSLSVGFTGLDQEAACDGSCFCPWNHK